jgi:hypothetical protein
LIDLTRENVGDFHALMPMPWNKRRIVGRMDDDFNREILMRFY